MCSLQELGNPATACSTSYLVEAVGERALAEAQVLLHLVPPEGEGGGQGLLHARLDARP